jgi:lysophospholipase L1-like esterase
MRALALTLAAATIIAADPVAATGATIQWRIENPFRFFTDSEVLEPHRKALARASSTAGKPSVLAAERWLSTQYPYGWAEQAFRRTCWHLVRQDLSACGGLANYIQPRSHRIIARVVALQQKDVTCTWRVRMSGSPQLTAKVLERPCSAAVEIDIPYPTGADVSVSDDGQIRAATTVRVNDIFIVGLGDSYASGEGNPDRPVRWRDDRVASFGSFASGIHLDGYPERLTTTVAYAGRNVHGPSAFWLSQPCHRSLYSYQVRVALQLALEDPHRAVTFLGVSCSGADIASGLLAPWKGVEPFPASPTRSQVGEVAVAQCGGTGYETRTYGPSFTSGGAVPALDGLTLQRCPPEQARKIDLILLSAGGNDIGFAKLVAYAILRENTPLRRFSELSTGVLAPRQALSRFPELQARYKLLRRALHNHLHVPWTEPDRVILTAYPVVALQRDGRTPCSGTATAGLDGFPGYRLDGRRAAEAEQVAARLTTLMRDTARKYGWSFVSGHRLQFAGRGVCAGLEGGREIHDQLMLPRWTGSAWHPYAPSQYRAYVPRQRWIRTSNDAFLTAHVDLSTEIKRQFLRNGSYRPMDLLKASTFGGAFHPTAEGQAAIADAVLPTARAILAKYVGDGKKRAVEN